MIKRGSIHFRTYLILLFFLIYLISMVLIASYFIFYRLPRLEEQNIRSVSDASRELAVRFEQMLSSIQEQTRLFVLSSEYLDPGDMENLIESMTDPLGIQSVLLVDEGGIVTAAAAAGRGYQKSSLILGNDLFYNPLFMEAVKRERPVWSDKYLSPLGGDTAIAVAVSGEEYTAIAEVSWEYIISTLKLARAEDYLSVWILDGRGNVVADTEGVYATGVDNLMNLDFVRKALQGDIVIPEQDFMRKKFNVSSSYSEYLGWVFITRIPVGKDNPDINSRFTDLLFLLLGQAFLILFLTPLLARPISFSMSSLAAYAARIADHSTEGPWKSHLVWEINGLAENLRFMAGEVQQREASLRDLNQDLEDRVKERTEELGQANSDLRQSLDYLNRMKDELVEAEKLSALGSLVAGISHELNTPMGNALMAVSAMMDRHREFLKIPVEDLNRQDLADYLEQVGTGLSISHRNLEKSSELVSSFKQVAVDQTSSKRRVFSLDQMLTDLLLALQPLLKASPVRIVREFQKGVTLDSYPGILGQIITNLVTNALIHGYEESTPGEIYLTSSLEGDDRAVVTVRDLGKGMSEETMCRIFDPFFTTRHGEGGSGLGLSIAFNGARKVLGGTIEVESAPGEGTLFKVIIPLKAPLLEVRE
ncbi:MAG: ATP-binding protein [Spirochaetales bacterium]|nr:ATP-binding protein [Spirochaetales bacterium]